MESKNTTLVIMAAGLGTRFGKGKIKQLEPIGPNGEIIMDYSIYDAKSVGFNKMVFIIREDIKDAFDKMIGNRIGEHIETDYVFQKTSDLPSRFKGISREKPWGTAHAVWCCRDVVNEPFAVINADDVYGRATFKAMHDFLIADHGEGLHLAMPGFILSNTLSACGTVTRGICHMNENNYLEDIVETYGIGREENGDVTALTERYAETKMSVDPNAHVSMNMWACPANFIDKLTERFECFLEKRANEKDSEFLLPSTISYMLHNGATDCRVIETGDKWFGMTSAADKAAAQQAVLNEIENGIYPYNLWG